MRLRVSLELFGQELVCQLSYDCKDPYHDRSYYILCRSRHDRRFHEIIVAVGPTGNNSEAIVIILAATVTAAVGTRLRKDVGAATFRMK
jgi:CO/xanthine dehydrogenase FAD-binding subunit